MDGSQQTLESNGTAASRSMQCLVLPLDLAFIRWSVVHRQWHELANDMPLLSAFLAGWCCRCIGASQPADIGTFRDSFRVGWREADQQIEIEARGQNAPGMARRPGHGGQPESQSYPEP